MKKRYKKEKDRRLPSKATLVLEKGEKEFLDLCYSMFANVTIEKDDSLG